MKSYRMLLIIGLLIPILGCLDSLAVPNLNDPDADRVLATPSDVEALIAGTYQTFWIGTENWSATLLLSAAADELTSGFNCNAMRTFGNEPRTEIPNTSTWAKKMIALEDPWFDVYSAISSVNEGLIRLDDGLEIGEDGIDTPRARAFAKFVQGISYGWLACYFDQAFIVDESIPLEDLAAGTVAVDLMPYSAVMDAAIGYLAECIAIADANDFTIDEWINGVTITNAQLSRLAHSYSARYMANVARTPSERADVDWTAIKMHTLAGITADWGPVGDGSGSKLWYSWGRSYLAASSFIRADYKTIGETDQSGAYQNWLDTPVSERTEMLIDPADRRITGANGDMTSSGLYFKYEGNSSFRASQGTYHFSMYRYTKWDEYRQSYSTQMTAISIEEMNFLTAEAEYRAANLTAAATIIDSYGVTIGELPAVDATNATEVFKWLKYNKRIEVFYTGSGVAFFDDRGWGDLVTGTPIHMPVPAKELDVSELAIYTFGGGGAGSAPKALQSIPDCFKADGTP